VRALTSVRRSSPEALPSRPTPAVQCPAVGDFARIACGPVPRPSNEEGRLRWAGGRCGRGFGLRKRLDGFVLEPEAGADGFVLGDLLVEVSEDRGETCGIRR